MSGPAATGAGAPVVAGPPRVPRSALVADPPPPGVPTADAVMARMGGENFTVAALLLPAAARRHLRAVYGFARLVDDAADEPCADREAVLAWLEREVERVVAVSAATHPLTAALGRTMRECDIPPAPLRDLVAAARLEQEVTAFETFEELRASCALSADPVGRLVLHALGVATADRLRWSDAICSALQIAEHCQDVAEDLARGHVFLPQADLRRHGCTAQDLAAPSASPAVRAVVALQVVRARALLADGMPLVASMRGRARLAVAGYAGGGLAALDAIERAGCDVLSTSPRASRVGRAAAVAAILAEARR